jgi:hypothetical protein
MLDTDETIPPRPNGAHKTATELRYDGLTELFASIDERTEKLGNGQRLLHTDLEILTDEVRGLREDNAELRTAFGLFVESNRHIAKMVAELHAAQMGAAAESSPEPETERPRVSRQ